MLRPFTNNWRTNDVLLLLPLWPTGPCVYCDASSCLVLLVSLFVVVPMWSWKMWLQPSWPFLFCSSYSLSLFLFTEGEVYVAHCISFLSSTTEKNLRGNAHFDHFFPLRSLFPFLLSCTTPSSQSWGTTMLVINFLIPFISLSPPPLLSLLSAISLGSRSLLLAHHLCLAVSSVFSLSCKEHVKFSTSIILPYPNTSFYYSTMIPVTAVSVVIWSSWDHSTARKHLTAEHEGFIIQIQVAESHWHVCYWIFLTQWVRWSMAMLASFGWIYSAFADWDFSFFSHSSTRFVVDEAPKEFHLKSRNDKKSNLSIANGHYLTLSNRWTGEKWPLIPGRFHPRSPHDYDFKQQCSLWKWSYKVRALHPLSLLPRQQIILTHF